MRRVALSLAALTLAHVGCKSRKEGARERFSEDFTCPEDKVNARERPDLDAYDLDFGAPPPPSQEIQKDPQRWRLWRERQEETHRSWNNALSVFEASGCHHDAFYTCSHPSGSRGGTNLARASCSKANHPPGSKK
jgi:hypothetical protein